MKFYCLQNKLSFKITSLLLIAGLAAGLVPGLAPARSARAAAGYVKTIGVVQVKSNGTSAAIQVPTGGVGAGNSVLIAFTMGAVAGAVRASDPRGNTYSIDADVTDPSGKIRTLILSAHQVAALVGGDRITIFHPPVTARAASAAEFAGLARAGVLDRTSTAGGHSSSPSSGTTALTRQPDELLFGAVGVEHPVDEVFMPEEGFTLLARSGTSGGYQSNVTINPVYRITSATGSYAAAGELEHNEHWAAAIATNRFASYETPTPTSLPTQTTEPSPTATSQPTETQTQAPTATEELSSTATTEAPTASPTATQPVVTEAPTSTQVETELPTSAPTETKIHTSSPPGTVLPTSAPTETKVPTGAPETSETPLPSPTPAPTSTPTLSPLPTGAPAATQELPIPVTGKQKLVFLPLVNLKTLR